MVHFRRTPQDDLRNWRFDTHDIAPLLRAYYRHKARISYRLGLLVQGDGPTGQVGEQYTRAAGAKGREQAGGLRPKWCFLLLPIARRRSLREYPKDEGHLMSLKINIRETPDAVILDLSGRLTHGESLSELRDSIREALAGDQKNILLNLAEVTYLDSSGLGQLISSHAAVVSRGGQIKLLNLQKRVNDLMQVTKLLTVFDTYTSEQAALRSFAKKSSAP